MGGGGGVSQDEGMGCSNGDGHTDAREEKFTYEVCAWRKCTCRGLHQVAENIRRVVYRSSDQVSKKFSLTAWSF